MLEDKEKLEDPSPNPEIVAQLKARARENKLSCASIFSIAEALSALPIEVGRAATAVDIRFTRCQLGFFGYPNKQAWDQVDLEALPVPDGLITAMQRERERTGDVSCAKLWQIAATYDAPRLQVGYLADRLGIHVTPCQLGAF